MARGNDSSRYRKNTRTLLDEYHREYEYLNSIWRDIGGKAQIALGIVAIFVAGLFAFGQIIDSSTHIAIRFLMCIPIGTSVAVIVYGVYIFRIRDYPDPPYTYHSDELMERSSLTQGVQDRMVHETVKEWRRANACLHEITEDMAKHLDSMHHWLMASVATTAIAAIVIIIIGV